MNTQPKESRWACGVLMTAAVPQKQLIYSLYHYQLSHSFWVENNQVVR
jgi:hypothetical protein